MIDAQEIIRLMDSLFGRKGQGVTRDGWNDEDVAFIRDVSGYWIWDRINGKQLFSAYKRLWWFQKPVVNTNILEPQHKQRLEELVKARKQANQT